MTHAIRITEQKTRKATLEEALCRPARTERPHKRIRAFTAIGWEGDLDEMRRGTKP